jgi:hypothetical protein
LVKALVQHEGIGIVVTSDEAGVPIVLGKNGQRNLHTGEVRGEDPLKMYGDPDLRAQQVRRVADFPHAGDLMVISTVYPDGTVAAMEELIGNHGGMGGEQTDAFMFHPEDMVVPATTNSADVFGILNARRDTPVSEIKPKTRITAPAADAWAPATLWTGLKRGKIWLGRVLRTLLFDRHAYQEVARDPYMTGPALVIGLIGLTLSAITLADRFNVIIVGGRLLAWPIAVLLLQITARVLRGKGTYTSTFRVASFAYAGNLLGLLILIPPLASLGAILATLWSFLGVWLGTAQAHELRGWRTLVLPVLYIVVVVIVAIALRTLLLGGALTIELIFSELGL